MHFLIVTHVIHTKKGDDYFAYAPYVNEMNIWLKYVDKVTIIAPLKNIEIDSIYQNYNHPNIKFVSVPSFSFITIKESLKALFVIPFIVVKLFWVMTFCNHIHLRCPGNMGLLGCLVQLFFPFKQKSAKYAGNWGSNSNQALSYRIQKKILSSTILTRNIKVLVYGEWKDSTKNIVSFFTATYSKSEIKELKNKELNGLIQFIFVGTLSKGKQPIYALQIVESLRNKGHNVTLSFYGNGFEKSKLEAYIFEKKMEKYVFLKGNADRNSILHVYQNSHFLILASKSEGWPKVIAEAMFWGCLPVATNVSCVANMLDFGNRGLLLKEDLSKDVNALAILLKNQAEYNEKTSKAKTWSRAFTLEKFENEISALLKEKNQ